MKKILKILLADDNQEQVNFMKEIIEKNSQYEVIGIATTKDSEITLIDELKPDVVITDLRKQNEWIGLEIIKEYKTKEYNPIFFVVSASIVNYIEEMRSLEVRFCLTKPYDFKDLMKKLNEIYEYVYH